MSMQRTVVVLALVGSACGVPMSSSAPFSTKLPASGPVGFGLALESPPLDVLRTVTTAPNASDPHQYPTTNTPMLRLLVARDINKRLQAQVGLDASFYAILPVPHAGYLGLGAVAWQRGGTQIGVGAHLGYAGFLSTGDEDRSIEDGRVHVGFAGLSTDLQFRQGKLFRPSASLTVQPMLIRGKIPGHDVDDVFGVSSSLTLRASIEKYTFFAAGTLHHTSNVRGTGTQASFGVALEI